MDLVRIGELRLRFVTDNADVVMFEFIVPSKARVPAPHYHEAADEIVYGVGGRLTSTVDGNKRELTAGDSLIIPRGRVHHHENLHADDAKALIVLTPGSIRKLYFEEIAEVVSAPGKPDPAKIEDIMRRHGLIPA